MHTISFQEANAVQQRCQSDRDIFPNFLETYMSLKAPELLDVQEAKDFSGHIYRSVFLVGNAEGERVEGQLFLKITIFINFFHFYL